MIYICAYVKLAEATCAITSRVIFKQSLYNFACEGVTEDFQKRMRVSQFWNENAKNCMNPGKILMRRQACRLEWKHNSYQGHTAASVGAAAAVVGAAASA